MVCGVVWCSVVSGGCVVCGVVRCVVQCGMWCGVWWCGVVWCSGVWCDVSRVLAEYGAVDVPACPTLNCTRCGLNTVADVPSAVPSSEVCGVVYGVLCDV